MHNFMTWTAIPRILGLGLLLLVASIASGAPATEQGDALTIYSGRSEELVGPIIEQFEKASGIDVRVRYGGTSELAATILEEGRNSPADLFWAQDPAGLGAVADRFATIPEATLARVEPPLRSPQGKWVGISGRARVVVYNTDRVSAAELPEDLWGFTDPRWRGRIGWAPTNGSFQAMVTAMRLQWGEERTLQWVKGIQANSPMVYSANTAIVAAVGTGEVDAGFVNHYYLIRFLVERGEDFPARNYHPGAGGPGAVILVAGAGVLETSTNKETAWRFLDFVLSPVAQQYFAGQTYEYPVIDGVKTHRLLTPLANINRPDVDMADLQNLESTLRLLRDSGVLP